MLRLTERAVPQALATQVRYCQEAAEAFSTRDRSSGIGVLVSRRRRRGDQPVVEALVVALEMIVRDKLRDREAEVALTERNELVEAFALDREHESLRKGVQIWAAGRELEALDAGGAEDRAERLGEQRVAVMDQVALVSQESVDAVGQVASDLLDPRIVWVAGVAGQAGNVHAAGLEVDDEPHDVADETAEREDLDGEEVGRRDLV
jgi:hypothetical protein